jgi:hypothetical protein
MSTPGDRRSAPRPFHTHQTETALGVVERNARVAALMAEAQRRFGGHDELHRAIAHFWATGLRALQPLPGQPPDSALTDVVITKRASGPMHFFGRISEINKKPWGVHARFAINCREASPPALRAAFDKVARTQVRQMRNSDLRAAGFVLDATVDDDAVVDLVAVISDPIACTKVAARAYTGCLVSMDGDAISDISLIDSPAGFMEKRSSIICKIYDGGSVKKDKDRRRAKKMSRINGLSPQENFQYLQRVTKVAAPVLPPSAQAALNNYEAAVAAVPNAGDQMAAKAAVSRAVQACQLEMIKGARRRPTAYGDGGMIDFLRNGRP